MHISRRHHVFGQPCRQVLPQLCCAELAIYTRVVSDKPLVSPALFFACQHDRFAPPPLPPLPPPASSRRVQRAPPRAPPPPRAAPPASPNLGGNPAATGGPGGGPRSGRA